ncbi:MAG: crossover junction endodeoxyribonuclease RuvC [Patescibacteria group bacterium]|nr:crossover junction endodeoxyribonuclease RuvC [Patescibacteria group bacterium]MCL5432120.1 crossover junction endodeoxyribonuclease RuvC [Patescibacteria group bacterium]
MLILGIDPGTARLGYGLIEVKSQKSKVKNNVKFVDAGCLETVLETAMPERLLYLQTEIGKILAKRKPDVLAIERLFFGINAKTAIAVGQARGVVLAESARYHVPVFEYQGLSVKFALTGFGRAKKKEIQESVRKYLGMKKIIKPDDAADGLAIAITHYIKTNSKVKI